VLVAEAGAPRGGCKRYKRQVEGRKRGRKG
jgi:hypothetical protein